MSLVSPSVLRAFLEKENLLAKKQYSQNFLIDGNILKKTLQIAGITSSDYVIEIGAGPGALTQALLDAGAHVLAIEIDPGFSYQLQRLQTSDHRLTVVAEDVLKLDIENLLSPFLPPGKKAKVVANLPYAIISPILDHFLPAYSWLENLTLMMQKEVAERILAKQGSNYSSLSVFVQTYSDISYGFTVSPSCFFPKPKVSSSIIKLQIKETIPEASLDAFFSFVKRAFGQRRKMLTSIFKEDVDKTLLRRILGSLQLEENARVETIPSTLLYTLFLMLESFLPSNK